MPDAPKTTEAVIRDALGFAGVFDAPAVASHVLAKLKEAGFAIVPKTIPHWHIDWSEEANNEH